jgi:hypothetical protein
LRRCVGPTQVAVLDALAIGQENGTYYNETAFARLNHEENQMPLSREDYLALIRQVQGELRERDREVYELLAEHVEPSQDPRRYLLAYLDTLIKVVGERSAGAHGRVLNLINRSVRTAEGGPVRGIRLALSGPEQERYQTEYVDLASLPERGALIEALLVLRNDLAQEGDQTGGLQ